MDVPCACLFKKKIENVQESVKYWGVCKFVFADLYERMSRNGFYIFYIAPWWIQTHLNLQCWELKMVYLQSLQQSEVLKGSPLHDADLIVLQMSVAVDTERRRETCY